MGTATRLLRDIYGHRIPVECLPAYAPERNVVDHTRGHTTYGELAHFIPHDVADLTREVAQSLIATHSRRDLLKSFFPQSRLAV